MNQGKVYGEQDIFSVLQKRSYGYCRTCLNIHTWKHTTKSRMGNSWRCPELHKRFWLRFGDYSGFQEGVNTGRMLFCQQELLRHGGERLCLLKLRRVCDMSHRICTKKGWRLRNKGHFQSCSRHGHTHFHRVHHFRNKKITMIIEVSEKCLRCWRNFDFKEPIIVKVPEWACFGSCCWDKDVDDNKYENDYEWWISLEYYPWTTLENDSMAMEELENLQ